MVGVKGNHYKMRTYLLTAPRRMVGLFSGLIFGIGSAVFARVIDPPTSWPVTAVIGVATGVLFGGAMAFTLGRQRRALRTAAGDLPPAQLSAAYRAAAWGPIPADPQIRAAAARVAQSRIEAVRRARILFAAGLFLLSAGAVVNVLAGNYGTAVLNVAAVLVLGSELYQLRRLPRRVESLSV
jgi:hypothetical protein